MPRVIAVDARKCVACKSCELTCAVLHSQSKNLYQAVFEDPLPAKRIFVENLDDFNLPLQCRHCEEPPCAMVCPTEALQKASTGEPVTLHQEKCIGCGYCLMACPFGVLVQRSSDGSIIKCDLCQGNRGERDAPGCVESCPTGALQYLSATALAKEKRREFMVEFKGAAVKPTSQ